MFIYAAGSAAIPPQTLTVQSGGVRLPLTWSDSALQSQLPFTPGTVSTTLDVWRVATQPLGEYHSSIQVTAPSGTVTVPVITFITSSRDAPPVISSIVNTASQAQGAVAPGEIITIRGFGVGPPNDVWFTLDPSGSVARLYNGTQVLFDGQPVPLIWASAYLTKAIVPYEVASRKSTTIEVAYNGIRSAGWGVPVAPAAPAIFTLDASGAGPAAALNQDNTVNDPLNPAPRGTVIQIFATGEGQTSPPGVTGSVTTSDWKKPALPVKVTIGGVDALVLYSGSAPNAVAGLLQVNVLVPQEVTPGPEVPVKLTIGDVPSPDGVTIAVE